MRALLYFATFILILSVYQACHSGREGEKESHGTTTNSSPLADILEESLFKYIIELWYPRDLDTTYGGFISDLDRDWSLSESSQVKALVQQARHVWATSRIYEAYPEKQEFMDYATHGFRFLRDAMWDREYGGFHAYCNRDGSPQDSTIQERRIYGQAFALYGLSQYYRMSKDPEALDLAKKGFLWMEEHTHDPRYGGYFETLMQDGTPTHLGTGAGDSPFAGIKDFNSSIHLMEAITELYRIWPDSLVRVRLEEMFFLIRDTFVHPDGYLQLYFHPDWTLVSDGGKEESLQGDGKYSHHFTYGHDVETAFLLLETAHILGWGENDKTHWIAKRLVDHSLESGWDHVSGGFFDAGKEIDGEIRIINKHKSWWGAVEGLNALLLMHTLYPDDPNDYYGKFLKSWEHIDTYLIDKEFGGWYNHALDTYPESVNRRKSHIWKTTYHNLRGVLNCIEMLQ